MSGDFFTNYFINPILNAEGYNPINTTVYALVLVIAAYLIFRLLQKLKIKIDRRLAIAVSPFVILGSFLRVLNDAGILTSGLFVTPLIYFLVAGITLATLFAALFLEKKYKIKYYKVMFVVGLTLAAIAVSFFKISNPYGAVLDLVFYLPWPIILYFVKWNDANKVVTSVQMFDATTTFTSLQFFNYREQHVVPNIFITIFSPISFIVVKAVAVIIILILIDKYSDDKEFGNYLKLIIGILGAATSLRDYARLVNLV